MYSLTPLSVFVCRAVMDATSRRIVFLPICAEITETYVHAGAFPVTAGVLHVHRDGKWRLLTMCSLQRESGGPERRGKARLRVPVLFRYVGVDE